MSIFQLIDDGRDADLYYEERFNTRVKLADALEAALEGLYRVYVNLGEDTDGARNAKELFGPWVGFDPATHVPNLVAETRKQWEDDYDNDLAKAWGQGYSRGRDDEHFSLGVTDNPYKFGVSND